jgi:CHRD domain
MKEIDTMMRSAVIVLALGALASACGGTTGPDTPNRLTFTADLKASNEVPAISNAESNGAGNATIVFDVTRDASNNVTAATAQFIVNLSGFPNGTPINIAHIHRGPAGSNGTIVVSTTLVAGEVTLANGSGSFTKSNISVVPVDILNEIVANPTGFYFNAHSTLNPGGVVRGQLARVPQ